MQAINEYCGLPVTWQLPRIKPGDEIRFWYWDSKFNQFSGKRGVVVSVRYLSANPVARTTKQQYDIVRGNTLYTVKLFRNRNFSRLYYLNSFYNHRMSNVEIIN